MKRSVAAFSLLLIGAGCSKKSSPIETPEASVSVTISNDPCDAIARARSEALDGGAGFGTPVEQCLRTKRGAWSLIATSGENDHEFTDYQIVHALGASVVAQDLTPWRKLKQIRVFDFDGDGEEELIIAGDGMEKTIWGGEGGGDPLPEAQVWKFDGAKIVPLIEPSALVIPKGLPSAFGHDADRKTVFREALDVDGDGRPDLTSFLFYEMSGSDGDQAHVFSHGPRFVAHSIATGGFALDDGAALAALKKECAKTPAPEAASFDDLFASSVCARLGGASSASAVERYAMRCAALERNDRKGFHGAPTEYFNADVFARCRVEVESWEAPKRGCPASIAKLLGETAPILSAASHAAKP